MLGYAKKLVDCMAGAVKKTAFNKFLDYKIWYKELQDGKPVATTFHDWRVKGAIHSTKVQFDQMNTAQAKQLQFQEDEPGQVHGEAQSLLDVQMHIRKARAILIREAGQVLDGRVGGLRLGMNATIYNPQDKDYEDFYFESFFQEVNPNKKSIESFMDDATADLQEQMERFNKNGSGKVFGVNRGG
jgi:hypothetical protein